MIEEVIVVVAGAQVAIIQVLLVHFLTDLVTTMTGTGTEDTTSLIVDPIAGDMIGVTGTIGAVGVRMIGDRHASLHALQSDAAAGAEAAAQPALEAQLAVGSRQGAPPPQELNLEA